MVYLTLEKKLNPQFLRTILVKKAEDPENWNTTKFLQTLNDAVRRESNIREVMDEYGHQKGQSNQKPQQQLSRMSPRNRGYDNPRNRGSGNQPQGRERTFINASVESQQQNKSKGDRARKPIKRRASAPAPSRTPLVSDSSDSNSTRTVQNKGQPTSPCAFCEQKHWHDRCTKYSTLEQRKEIVKAKNLCWRCLHNGHISGNCPRPATCFKCKASHPTALCPKPIQHAAPTLETQTEAQYDSISSSEESTKCACCNHAKPKEPETHDQVLLSREKLTKALLMTTEATIFNPANPRQSMIASVFIDNGSQRSFISARAAEQLQLEAIEKEECYLTSFGDPNEKRYLSDRVKIGLLCDGGEKMIFTLNKMKFIFNKMPIVALSSIEEDQLRKKRIALPQDMREPDLMLGIDHFNDLYINPIEKLPSGFTLSQSRLGKILSGSGKTGRIKKSTATYTNAENPQIMFCGAVLYDSDRPGDPDPSSECDWSSESEESDLDSDHQPRSSQPMPRPSNEVSNMLKSKPVLPAYVKQWTSSDSDSDSESSDSDEIPRRRIRKSPPISTKQYRIQIPMPIRNCHCRCMEFRQIGKELTCICAYLRKSSPCTCNPEGEKRIQLKPWGRCKPNKSESESDSSDSETEEKKKRKEQVAYVLQKLEVKRITSAQSIELNETENSKFEFIVEDEYWHETNPINDSGKEIPSDINADEKIQLEISNKTADKSKQVSLTNDQRFCQWKQMKENTVQFLRFLKQINKSIDIIMGDSFLKQIHLHMQNEKLPTAQEFKLAELFLIGKAQKQFPPTESQIRDLRLYKDGPEGFEIWKSKGPLGDSEVLESSQNTIFLHDQSMITKLFPKIQINKELNRAINQLYNLEITNEREPIQPEFACPLIEMTTPFPHLSQEIISRLNYLGEKQSDLNYFDEDDDAIPMGPSRLAPDLQEEWEYHWSQGEAHFNQELRDSLIAADNHMSKYQNKQPYPPWDHLFEEYMGIRKFNRKYPDDEEAIELDYEEEIIEEEPKSLEKESPTKKGTLKGFKIPHLDESKQKPIEPRKSILAPSVDNSKKGQSSSMQATSSKRSARPIEMPSKQRKMDKPKNHENIRTPSPRKRRVDSPNRRLEYRRESTPIRHQMRRPQRSRSVTPEPKLHYLTADRKKPIILDYNILTECNPDSPHHEACARNVTLGRIAQKRLVMKDYANCRAETFMQVLTYVWLARYQNLPQNERLMIHEAATGLLNTGQKETAKLMWDEKWSKLKKKPFDQSKIMEALEYWLGSCSIFEGIVAENQYGCITFSPIDGNELGGFKQFMNELQCEVNTAIAIIRNKKFYGNHILHCETIILGDNNAEILQGYMPNSRWFTFDPETRIDRKLSLSPKNERIVLCFSDEKNLARNLQPTMRKLYNADVETNLILQETRKNREWSRTKRQCHNLCQEYNAGFYIYSGKGINLRKIADKILSNKRPTQRLSHSPRGWGMLRFVPMLLTFLMLFAMIFSASATNERRKTSQGLWKPMTLEEMEEPIPKQEFWHLYPNLFPHLQKRVDPETTTKEPYADILHDFRAKMPDDPEARAEHSRNYARQFWERYKQVNDQANTNEPTTTTEKPYKTTTRRTTIKREVASQATSPMTQTTTSRRTTTTARTTTMLTTTISPTTVFMQLILSNFTTASTQAPQFIEPIGQEEEVPDYNAYKSRKRIRDEWNPLSMNGDPVVACSHRGGTLWRLQLGENSQFCRAPPKLNATWTKTTIHLYGPIIKPKPILTGYHCSAKTITESYYTNFLGDRFIIDKTEEMLHISRKDCRKMVDAKKCEFTKETLTGNPNGKIWQTNSVLDEEFPGRFASFFTGAKTSSVTNCFLQFASLYYKPHNMELLSPIHSLEDCTYANDFCALSDNSSLVWTSNCPNGKCSGCDFEFIKTLQGESTSTSEYAAATFLSNTREQALTFVQNARQVIACNGQQIRLSEQGFGILESEYQSIRAPRGKRYVNEQQLAAQLTATQISASRALEQLYQKECQRNQRNENPTIQARQLLRNPWLMARWIGTSALEVFSCGPIQLKEIGLRATTECFLYIPIKVRIRGSIREAFLDPVLRIISSSSPVSDCGIYKIHYFEVSKNVWKKIDTEHGNQFGHQQCA